MVESNAVAASEAAAIVGAHVPFRASDGCFAALQAACLTGGELAASYTLPNALLLVFTALVDCGWMARGMHGSSLAKANGGAKCEKSDAKHRKFHGCISLGGGGLFEFPLPIRSHIHGDTSYGKVLRRRFSTANFQS
jgi:hypothetical protein